MGNGMNKVIPGLYVGNIKDSEDEVQLKDNNITHILSIHESAKPVYEDKTYMCIKAKDTSEQNLQQHFRDCTAFIHEARTAGGHVLVHCQMGMSRSVTVTSAYLMTISGIHHEDAVSIIKTARDVACPNEGFMNTLDKFGSKSLKQERSWFTGKFGQPSKEDLEFIEHARKHAIPYTNGNVRDVRKLLRQTGLATG